MMDKTIQALKNSQNVLLELPTGSGKSLSLLCAAAAWHAGAVKELQDEAAQQKTRPCESVCMEGCEGDDDTADTAPQKKKREKPKRPPKVYIASRTHAQLAQLVRELRKSGYSNVHMQVLGSREQYCINTDVLKSDQPKAQACKDLVNKNACRYVHGAPRLEKHERLQEGGDLRIHDIEDLVKLGKSIGGCPYFASSSLAKEASFIFCPYSYLLDPMTRDAMSIDLKDAAVIIDEAHNIEDVSRDAAGLDLRYDDLVETCAHLEKMLLSDEGSDEAQNYTVCICICTCVCTYIHVHTFLHIYVYIYKYVCMYIQILLEKMLFSDEGLDEARNYMLGIYINRYVYVYIYLYKCIHTCI